MRRIKLVIVALALVMATFAAFAGPAMADNLNCRDAQGFLIRCNGQFFAPVSSNFNDGCFNGCFNTGFSSPFFNTGFNGFGGFGGGCAVVTRNLCVG
jgi:hypothetical protein